MLNHRRPADDVSGREGLHRDVCALDRNDDEHSEVEAGCRIDSVPQPHRRVAVAGAQHVVGERQADPQVLFWTAHEEGLGAAPDDRATR